MSPEPHRANPAFGTIAILKGNLASRQVPFFREIAPSGPFVARVEKLVGAGLRRRPYLTSFD